MSPVAGTWHNVQPLVLNVESGTEIYYSLSGSDPLRFGFAYDGPVVLPQKGKVSVRITALDAEGSRSDFTVDYEVQDLPFSGSAESSAFVQTFLSNPIRKYISGSAYKIPAEFSYSIGASGRSFSGRELMLSSRNTMERYVPVQVEDAAHRYRFVLHVTAIPGAESRQKQLPFVIDNWKLLTFASSAYSYRIDGGEWSNEPGSILIDRLSTHTVMWKDARAKGESADDVRIYSYTLPPLPQLASRTEKDGAVTFTLSPPPFSSAQYKLGAIPQDLSLESVASGLHDSVTVDAFYGEDLTKDFVAGVYFDGLFQGTLSIPYSVDRLPPEAPLISSRAQKRQGYSKTELVIQSEAQADIYVALSSPLEFDEGTEEAMRGRFESLATGDFHLYRDGELTLSSGSELATFYKIRSYAVDRAGNKSEQSEYRLIVDEHNFYLNPQAAEGGEQDGSFSNPFASFEQAVYALNGAKDMHLHVVGRVEVKKSLVLRSSCTVIGMQSLLFFADKASLTIEDADVVFQHCSMAKKSASPADSGLLRIRGGSLSLEDCQLSAVFALDGILLRAERSKLRLVDSALTSHAASYTCDLSAADSELTALRSHAVAVARTGVNFSLNRCVCSLSRTIHSVAGHLGRCLEVSRSALDLRDNTFSASFDLPPSAKARQSLEAVWKDADTVLRSDINNVIYGF